MKNFGYLAILLPLALIASSCNKEENNIEEQNDGRTICVHIAQPGKTIFSGSLGSYSTKWGVGDHIYVSEFFEGENLYGNDETSSETGVQSEDLTAEAEVANFTVNFSNSAPDPTQYTDYHMTYFATSTYGLDYNVDGNGQPVVTLNMPNVQKILPGPTPTTPNAIDIDADLMVSQLVQTTSRPADLTFAFARVGTIVKINLAGLPANATIDGGVFNTGESFIAANNVEASNYYWPNTGQYRVYGGEKAVRFYTDNSTPVVTDADGKVSILLRTFAGVINDWFELFVDVKDGDNTVTYSKFVDCNYLGRAILFNESGVTEFGVTLKPAQANDKPTISYTTSNSANHDGFEAVWEQGEHIGRYRCYYYVEPDNSEDPIHLRALTPSSYGGNYYGVSVASGLAAGTYHLLLRSVPDDESGPIYGGYADLEMTIGSPVSLELVGNATLVSEGVYSIKNRDSWLWTDETANFLASNVYFGSYYDDYIGCSDEEVSSWWLRTSYSQTFPGGLESFEYRLHKWYYDDNFTPAAVYGINGDNSETLLSPAETTDNSSYIYYKYSLDGYVGLKLSGDKHTLVKRAYLNYYK